MIILRTPKGWTGPKSVDGLQIEGTFRSHQVPMGDMATTRAICAILEQWMKSYRPEELFDETGGLVPELRRAWRRRATRRMSANPHANGGLLLTDLQPAGLSRLRRGGPDARRASRRKPRRIQGSSSAT